jgi:putative membrane protein
MGFIAQWLIAAVSILLTAYILPGIKVRSFVAALLTAVILGVVNLFIRPVLLFLTFPINILTLGLFTLVVNGITLKIAAALTPGFSIRSWGSAILGAFLISLINNGIYWLLYNGAY